MSRPQITFGFNLRSPLQLLLYQKLMDGIRKEGEEIARESIREQADHTREMNFMDDLINKNSLVQNLVEEVILESYYDHMG